MSQAENEGSGSAGARGNEVRECPGYNAASVTSLFVPISVCMLLVVVTVNTVTFYGAPPDIYTIITPFEHDRGASWKTKLWQSLINVAIVLVVIIAVTVAVVLLYKYRCYKVIFGWLVVTSVIMEYALTYVYLQELLIHFNVPLDYVTLSVGVWNFGTVAMLCIYWKGPMRLQQAFLVISSALIALTIIKFFPEWTLWFLLAVICLWDLVAVLCPFGPLRYLVEMAQERNEELFPSLIYSTRMVWMADSGRALRHKTPKKPQHTGAGGTGNGGGDRSCGIKLGLGDFIFYSVLVGKASLTSDLVVTIICFVAILVGLCLTILLLMAFNRALPALPISISLGLLFYFVAAEFAVSFGGRYTVRQLYI